MHVCALSKLKNGLQLMEAQVIEYLFFPEFLLSVVPAAHSCFLSFSYVSVDDRMPILQFFFFFKKIGKKKFYELPSHKTSTQRSITLSCRIQKSILMHWLTNWDHLSLSWMCESFSSICYLTAKSLLSFIYDSDTLAILVFRKIPTHNSCCFCC